VDGKENRQGDREVRKSCRSQKTENLEEKLPSPELRLKLALGIDWGKKKWGRVKEILERA